jgi:membrane-associated protease RseP (regulator of RpoE activity)
VAGKGRNTETGGGIMIKKAIAAVVVLGAGVAMVMYLGGGTDPVAPAEFTPRTGASETQRIRDLENALAAQVERGNLLDTRLAELEARLGARGGAAASIDPRADRAQFRQRFVDADGSFDPATARQRMREQQLDRLVQAGFTRERAEWIERRSQELQLQAQQAQYDAQRNGQPFRGADTQSALRKELGDAEYEKYLAGTGRPTNVPVMEVLASSAAEKSGLKAGDQILSYAGTRVFEMSELNALTRQGSPGESVTVEVQRDGQTVQLQVPRGVLGVQGGGGGPGGGGFGGPPPGGFRGGPGGFGGG